MFALTYVIKRTLKKEMEDKGENYKCGRSKGIRNGNRE